jgi:hypothetical protein
VKSLMHLVPCAGLEPGDFGERLAELAITLARRPDASGHEIVSMSRLESDPFGPRTPWQGTLEIAGQGATEAALAELVGASAEALEGVAELEQSTLLLGQEVVFIAAQRAPIRYQYLMRKGEDFSHESYLRRYRDVHFQFGVRTPGIDGYVQFHVDSELSRRLAEREGFGISDIDSVSELHLASLEFFLAEVAGSTIGAEAVADEKHFVDRAASFDFCSSVQWGG